MNLQMEWQKQMRTINLKKTSIFMEIGAGLAVYILSFIWFGWQAPVILFLFDMYRNAIFTTRVLNILNQYNETINMKVEESE